MKEYQERKVSADTRGAKKETRILSWLRSVLQRKCLGHQRRSVRAGNVRETNRECLVGLVKMRFGRTISSLE